MCVVIDSQLVVSSVSLPVIARPHNSVEVPSLAPLPPASAVHRPLLLSTPQLRFVPLARPQPPPPGDIFCYVYVTVCLKHVPNAYILLSGMG